MSDLAAFLRARLDEDERVARLAPPGPWSTSGPDTIAEWVIHDQNWAVAEARAYIEPTRILPDVPKPESYIDANATATHIALNDPAYVLADVAAKRRIVDLAHRHRAGLDEDREEFDLWHYTGQGYILHKILRLLAAPYADHPDFDPAWWVDR
jgi:hypothetical protein